jgi:hypothetical protein
VIGLNDWARNLVDATVEVADKVERSYPCGKHTSFNCKRTVPLARVEILPSHAPLAGGFFVELHRYTFPDGRIVEEYVQHTEKNCDVYVFLALRDSAGNSLPESVWESWLIAVRAACYCKHTC